MWGVLAACGTNKPLLLSKRRGTYWQPAAQTSHQLLSKRCGAYWQPQATSTPRISFPSERCRREKSLTLVEKLAMQERDECIRQSHNLLEALGLLL
ncbi:hypothetical protein Krac_8753 [Ktedonobacter racemifer DSM 44963]|uniref:Uncharacterized protein n=1 Tax=Ktedonobacter racemifer DSM 44963 TaxID=485913 RepID=D6TP65_KTERA|nr:hypothetical protein Krac_8753 [Ktedonobacter racemifer DSM 44963]